MNTSLIAAVAVCASLMLPSGAAHASSISIAQLGGDVVSGLHVVQYPGAGKIAGVVAGAPAGARVTLEQLAFPFAGGYSTAATAVTRAGGAYAFTVHPAVGTRYRAVSGTSTSKAVAYYITNSGTFIRTPNCIGIQTCHATAVVEALLPPSVAPLETAKHIYFYDATRAGSVRPARLNLDPQAVTSVRKITNSLYRITASWTMLSTARSTYGYTWCTRDTYAQDGFGLPTATGCGAPSVPNAAGYLG